MHSIGGGIVVQKRCARLRPVRLQLAIEERAVLEVSSGVGRHEGALRDQPFSIASTLRKRHVPAAIRTLGRTALAAPPCGAGRRGFSRRLRARRRRMAFQAGSLLDCPGYGRGKRGEPRVSGRTATDGGFAVRSADLLFRRGGVRPAALYLRAVAPGRCDRARLRVNCMPRQISSPCFTARTEDLSQQALLEHSRRALEAE
ncbi:hypothetical protein ACVWVY_008130 [Bradyrhizobium sp. URHC0002]|jgi:hypothetical protein